MPAETRDRLDRFEECVLAGDLDGAMEHWGVVKALRTSPCKVKELDHEHPMDGLKPHDHTVHIRAHEAEYLKLQRQLLHEKDPDKKADITLAMRKCAAHWNDHRRAKFAPPLDDKDKLIKGLTPADSDTYLLPDTDEWARIAALWNAGASGAEDKRSGTVYAHGLTIKIENPAGSTRRGKNPERPWETTMRFPYGEIEGTKGADGDPMDVFLGPDALADTAYIVHQHNIGKVLAWPGGTCPKCGEIPANCPHDYDEDKVFLGFTDETEALAAFTVSYDQPDNFMGPISRVPVSLLLDYLGQRRKAKDAEALAFQLGVLTKSFSLHSAIKFSPAMVPTVHMPKAHTAFHEAFKKLVPFHHRKEVEEGWEFHPQHISGVSNLLEQHPWDPTKHPKDAHGHFIATGHVEPAKPGKHPLHDEVHAGLKHLAGNSPDGAKYQNGVGFNKIDADFGTKLAHYPSLSWKQVEAGHKLLTKYKDTQLGHLKEALYGDAAKAKIAQAQQAAAAYDAAKKQPEPAAGTVPPSKPEPPAYTDPNPGAFVPKPLSEWGNTNLSGKPDTAKLKLVPAQYSGWKSHVLMMTPEMADAHPVFDSWEKGFIKSNLGKSGIDLSPKQLEITKQLQAKHKTWVLANPEVIPTLWGELVGKKEEAKSDLVAAQSDTSLVMPKGYNAAILHGGELFSHQKAGVNWLMKVKRGILALATGLGKALDDDAKVLTPTGWVRNGDILPGDMVIAGDGMPTRVQAVFPQGEVECFRVGFSDGSSVVASDDHLWVTMTRADRVAKSRGVRVIPARRTTRELLDSLTVNAGAGVQTWNHTIPMVRPVEFEETDVPVQPYLLGVLLGDGGLTAGARLSCADDEILKLINELLPEPVRIVPIEGCDYNLTVPEGTPGYKGHPANPLVGALKQLGLFGHDAFSKFIPKQYLYNSRAVRLALLRGLMDSDGHVSKDGVTTQFYTSSQALADGVIELVQSFGGTAEAKPAVKQYVYRGEKRMGHKSLTVHISLPGDVNPFLLTRKARQVKPKTKYLPTRYVVSVEPVGRKSATCIRVEHPSHLYVTEGFIVTHNTNTVITAFEKLKEEGKANRMCFAVPKGRMMGTAQDIEKLFPGKKVVVLSGSSMGTAAQLSKKFPNGNVQFFTNIAKNPSAWEACADADYIVCGYDPIRKHAEKLAKLCDVVAFDECVRIKGTNSQVAKEARDKFKDTEYVWYMSATPIPNSPMDLFNLMHGLNKSVFGSLEQFRSNHCQFKWNPFKGKYDLTGYKDTKKTRDDVKAYIYHRDYDSPDVNVDMPKKHYVTTKLDMPDDMAKVYKAAQMSMLELALSDGAAKFNPTNALVQLLRLEQISLAPQLLDPTYEGSTPKLDEAIQVIKDKHSTGDKSASIVFSHFLGVQPIMEKKLREQGYKNAEIATIQGSEYKVGGKSVKTIQDVVDAVNSGEVKVLLASDAAMEGLNLQYNSNSVIHLDTPWRPDSLEQREGRVYRPGQKNVCGFIHLLMNNGIEDFKEAKVINKAKNMAAIVAGKQADQEFKLTYKDYIKLLGGDTSSIKDEEPKHEEKGMKQDFNLADLDTEPVTKAVALQAFCAQVVVEKK